MTMTSTRMNRLGPKIWTLCLLLTTAAGQAVRAQGFGPDPFRPYNNQYDAYTYPIAPGGADAAQTAAMMRSGLRGANQFENYLAEIQGLGRSGTERYGQGLPYFRSAVDPNFDKGQKRDYRPNRSTERSFEETQQRLTAKYLAYFEERDPKKRAQLLREYQQYRRQTNRTLTAHRESSSRVVQSADRVDSADRDRSSTTERGEETPRSTTRSAAPRLRSSDSTTRTGPRSTPPPPRRSSRPGSPSGTLRTPSDVLDRAGRLDSSRGTSRPSRGSATDRNRDSRLPSEGSPPND
jgi:hypothetical protein